MKSGGEDTCLDKSKNRKKLIQKINKKTKAVDLLDWSEHALQPHQGTANKEVDPYFHLPYAQTLMISCVDANKIYQKK